MPTKENDNNQYCPKCGAILAADKVSDISCCGIWVDLHIVACEECGWIDNENTWVE